MNQIFIGLGSNLGDVIENIDSAIQKIESNIGTVLSKSSLYETPPLGFVSENSFCNAVIEIESILNPIEILKELKKIEAEMGRVVVTSGEYTDRCIDLDLLFYGTTILDTEDILVPHPRITERNFVLYPFNEIAPNFEHPVFLKTMHYLFLNSPDTSLVTILEV
jgi:2-amino-4-hydroxy-6-hydroxymethyldihydropteridine diphosphokinase